MLLMTVGVGLVVETLFFVIAEAQVRKKSLYSLKKDTLSVIKKDKNAVVIFPTILVKEIIFYGPIFRVELFGQTTSVVMLI